MTDCTHLRGNKEERRWSKTLSSHRNDAQSRNDGDSWRVENL